MVSVVFMKIVLIFSNIRIWLGLLGVLFIGLGNLKFMLFGIDMDSVFMMNGNSVRKMK